jgi:peptidoglycan hydrolase-like protein with peptidoglycan-binding domain
MNIITNGSRILSGSLFIASLSLAIIAVFIVTAPQARAAVFPNVLIGPDMTTGSRGESVVVLQSLLSELGYLSVPQSIPLGYFGSMTKNALANYQIALNVAPTSGYFGQETKTAVYSQFASRGWLSLLGW